MRGLHRSLIPRILAFFLTLTTYSAGRGQAPTLPIWIEESHAGSFYFLAQTLELHTPHTLILFDAHSDASGIADSDRIRQAIRQVASIEDRAKLLDGWRQRGRIQCYNWIEPLMPLPITEVIWVPARHLEEAQRAQMEADARAHLDCFEEGLPRDDGPLAPRFHVLDFEHFMTESAQWPRDKAAVGSIDLDYFAALSEDSESSEVEAVVEALLRLRGLKALTWSLSTPWLRSTAQAERLLHAALDTSWLIDNALVRWEPFAKTGPDHSLMAQLAQRRGERLPEYHLADAGPALRTLVLQHWSPACTRNETEQLQQLLNTWGQDPFLPTLKVDGRAHEPGGGYAVQAGEPWRLKLTPTPTGAHVRWMGLRYPNTCYRICDADFGFASDAPRWLHEKPIVLREASATAYLDGAEIAPLLDPQWHCGAARVYAEVLRDGEAWRSNTVPLHVSAAETKGLRAAWSRHFAQPYAFGATWFHKNGYSGPEADCGADCANFVIHGFRAQGWLFPWGSPGDFRRWLEPWQGPIQADAGCVLNFGTHLAVLWEDKPPYGVLNDDDLVLHHLEGLPAIIPYGELKKGRAKPEILRLHQPAHPVRLIFGGDVMLGRKVGAQIRQGHNPMAALVPTLKGADLAMVNLECPILPAGQSHDLKAIFAAPAEGASMLAQSGIGMVTVANNHALDRHAAGLDDTLENLRHAKIQYCGAGADSNNALQPIVANIQGKRLAFISAFLGEETRGQAGHTIAATVRGQEVTQAIAQASETADLVIVFPHWGEEHVAQPSAEQRAWAQDWLNAGARLIVGSGPHVVQRVEHFPFGSVAWSLGNLIFDGPGPDPEWNRGALLEVLMDADTGRLSRIWLRPVKISNDGFAELVDE